MSTDPRHLASFREFCAAARERWSFFLAKRAQWLVQQERLGTAAEKVAESVLADFFTVPLGWKIGDLNHQVGYADLVLTTLGIKRMVIEVKRPGSLAWDQPSLEHALAQAWRYASEQRVLTIAVSDGTLFFAADIANGGLRPRARLRLDRPVPPLDAFWVSVDGIYRIPEPLDAEEPATVVEAEAAAVPGDGRAPGEPTRLLHPKYHLPAECFAYVGDASDPRTWKLPYRRGDGSADETHLSGAVRCIVSNFRGARVTLPEKSVPDVLARLGKAAAELGKLPSQAPNPPETYRQLYEALLQLNRLDEVIPPAGARRQPGESAAASVGPGLLPFDR